MKSFAPLFWTQFLGAFNDNFLKNALVIIVTFKVTSLLGIASSQLVVAAGGIFILPFFLFSATAGQLADKYEKTKLIRIIKLVEIGIMLLASVAFILQAYEILFLVLFLMGVHSTFFGPLKYSILPQLVDEMQLVGANALIEAGTFLAILLGTIGGGILISWENKGPYVVSLGLLLVAILGYASSKSIPIAEATDTQIKVDWNIVRPTWDILKFAKSNKPVFLSILGISWFWFFGAALLSLFPHYGKDTLNANEHVVTFFLAIFSIGIGIGSLLCEIFSRKRLELGLVPMGSIGITVFSFDLFRIGSPHIEGSNIGVMELLHNIQGLNIVFDLFCLSVVSGFFIIPLYTMIQERTNLSHRSRVIAANNILNAVFMVGAALCLMFLQGWGFTIPQIFLFLALTNGIASIYIYTILPEFFFRFIAWIIANIMYRMKIRGEENIPSTGPALLICNHVSFVDWLIIAAAIKRPVHFVMDYNFAKNWIVRRFMKRAKVILIATAKEDPVILQAAYDQIAKDLSEGELVCIFPEGRITKTGHMNLFRHGVEHILNHSAVPVIPMALTGLWGSFFSRRWGDAMSKLPKKYFRKVKLFIGPVVPLANCTAVDLQNIVCKLGDLYPPLEELDEASNSH